MRFLYLRALLVSFAVLLVPAVVRAAANSSTRLIAAPVGWTHENTRGSAPGPLGLVLAEFFTYDRGDDEYIEIGRRPSYGFTDESFHPFYQAYLKKIGDRVYIDRPQRLCRGEVGWFVKHGGSRYSDGMTVEDVYFTDGANVYFASYHYPAKYGGPLPAGERAIESLCIQSPVVAKAPTLPVRFSAPPGYLISNPKQMNSVQWPGIIAYFFSPTHPEHTLFIARDRAEGEAPTVSDRQAESTFRSVMKREHIQEKTLSYDTYGIQPLCNDHTGWLFKYTVRYGHTTLAYEQMMLFGPVLYSAVYVRRASAPVYQPARAALRTICPIEPKSTPTPLATPSSTPTP